MASAPRDQGLPTAASATGLHRVPSNPALLQQQQQPPQRALPQGGGGGAGVSLAAASGPMPSSQGQPQPPQHHQVAVAAAAAVPLQHHNNGPASSPTQQLQTPTPPTTMYHPGHEASPPHQQQQQQQVTLPQAFEKKLRRLEKNRESARECRRRKKEHVMELQKQVAMLEAENLKLKLQLKVGEESEAQERQEKERITKKLDEMVKSGASESDIWQTIDMFKERYSDYGSDRRSAIEFHTNQLEKLLLPTKLTKLCMWMLLHVSGSEEPSASSTTEGKIALTNGTSRNNNGGNETEAPGAEAKQKQAAARHLWATISKELEVTEAQQQALLAQRVTIEGMDRDLRVTSSMLDDLRALIEDKNSSLDQEMLEVQKILTPTQTAKFILWITQNPACMFMLRELWRVVYEKAPAEDEDGASRSSGSNSMLQPPPQPPPPPPPPPQQPQQQAAL